VNRGKQRKIFGLQFSSSLSSSVLSFYKLNQFRFSYSHRIVKNCLFVLVLFAWTDLASNAKFFSWTRL
jgi:hypothetical protein